MPSLTKAPPLSALLDRLQLALGDAYRLERELGGGGMSHVFLATEASLNRHVVIKVLPPELVSEVSSARFKREMELTAQLHHPHILPVLSAGARDDLMFYVMPFVEGESLRHRLSREKQLPVADAVRILRELADALAFAHRHGVIHRDVKPENVLLEDGHAVLADFGVARALISAGADKLTGTGMSVGTPGYMAPEQMIGETNIDARADVYSLALVGYEMLAGRLPFSGATGTALVTAQLTTPPIPLVEERPEVPLPVSHAVARALAKEPDDRFPTASAFRDALDALTPVSTASAARTAAGISGKAWGRKPAVAALAALAVIAAGAALLIRGRPTAKLNEDVLVVAPFNVLSPDLALWKEGVVDVLARNLDGAGPIRTISPSAVMRGWNGHADRESATELARRNHAGVAVFGTLEKLGRDSVRAVVTMLDVNSGGILSEVRRAEHAERVDRLLDSLTVGLLRELGRKRPIGDVRRAGVGSNSLPALKAFLQGEQYFRRTVFDSALASYQEAVGHDSAFALALYRAGTVGGWMNTIRDTAAAELTMRAAANLRGVGARDSLIIVADSIGRYLAVTPPNLVRHPELPKQLSRLFEITEVLERRYASDSDALYEIAEARYHHGSRLGRRQSRRGILEAFNRVIEADSGYAPAYIHAIELAFELGTEADGLRYLRAYNALASTDTYAEALRLVERLTDAALATTPDTRALLARASPTTLEKAGDAVWSASDSTEAALRLNEERSKRSTGVRDESPQVAATRMVDQLINRGRLREAASLLRQRRDVLAVPRASFILAEAKWFKLWPADTVTRLLAALPDTAPNAIPILALMDGDSGSVLENRQRLAARANEGVTPAREWLRMYDAQAALERADTAAALAALDTVRVNAISNPFPRLLKAELLMKRGQTAEALDIVRDGFLCPCTARVMMALMTAELAERAGERELAIENYALVARLWRKADPELQHLVKKARDGLARLGADERTPLRL